MKKRILSLLLAFVMVLSMAMPASAFGAVKDYDKHWASDTIQLWLDKGYVSGYPDGSFLPDSSITRAEFVTMVNKVYSFTETTIIGFTDVKSGDWFYTEVQKAFKAGYISGISETQFAPMDKLTREQAAVIIARIMKLQGNKAGINIFVDSNKISDWAREYVGAAATAELIKGYDTDNTFRPQNLIKRAEAIIVINNSLNKLPIPEVVTPPISPIKETGGTGGSGSNNSKSEISVTDINIVNEVTVEVVSDIQNLSFTWEADYVDDVEYAEGIYTLTVPELTFGNTYSLKATKAGYNDYLNEDVLWNTVNLNLPEYKFTLDFENLPYYQPMTLHDYEGNIVNYNNDEEAFYSYETEYVDGKAEYVKDTNGNKKPIKAVTEEEIAPFEEEVISQITGWSCGAATALQAVDLLETNGHETIEVPDSTAYLWAKWECNVDKNPLNIDPSNMVHLGKHEHDNYGSNSIFIQCYREYTDRQVTMIEKVGSTWLGTPYVSDVAKGINAYLPDGGYYDIANIDINPDSNIPQVEREKIINENKEKLSNYIIDNLTQEYPLVTMINIYSLPYYSQLNTTSRHYVTIIGYEDNEGYENDLVTIMDDNYNMQRRGIHTFTIEELINSMAQAGVDRYGNLAYVESSEFGAEVIVTEVDVVDETTVAVTSNVEELTFEWNGTTVDIVNVDFDNEENVYTLTVPKISISTNSLRATKAGHQDYVNEFVIWNELSSEISVTEVKVIDGNTVTVESNVEGLSFEWDGTVVSSDDVVYAAGVYKLTVPELTFGDTYSLGATKEGYQNYLNEDVVWNTLSLKVPKYEYIFDTENPPYYQPKVVLDVNGNLINYNTPNGGFMSYETVYTNGKPAYKGGILTPIALVENEDILPFVEEGLVQITDYNCGPTAALQVIDLLEENNHATLNVPVATKDLWYSEYCSISGSTTNTAITNQKHYDATQPDDYTYHSTYVKCFRTFIDRQISMMEATGTTWTGTPEAASVANGINTYFEETDYSFIEIDENDTESLKTLSENTIDNLVNDQPVVFMVNVNSLKRYASKTPDSVARHYIVAIAYDDIEGLDNDVITVIDPNYTYTRRGVYTVTLSELAHSMTQAGVDRNGNFIFMEP